MTSDKVIKYYKKHIDGVAPHEAYDITLKCAVIILEDLVALSPDNSISIKKGNNIWNFCRAELIKADFYPYMKEDQFKVIVHRIHKVIKKVEQDREK